jgi:hypothetical protein
MRKTIIVFMCIGILLSWQICQLDLAYAGGKGHKCSPAGTWIITVEGVPFDPGFVTTIPLDPTGKRFATIGDGPTPRPDPNWLGQDPPAVRATNLNGSMVKVGKNLYKTSYYSFGLDGAGNIVWEIEGSGMMKFIDCNHTVAVNSNTIYNNTGIDGGPPFSFCFPPFITRSERLEMFEPCEELPPFPPD